MNWKAWTPLVLALVLGLLAAKVARDLVLRQRRAGANGGNWVKVAIARRDLPPGHALGEQDLSLGTVAAEHMPQGAFRTTPEILGRILTTPMVKNQPVLESLLAPQGAGAGLQALIPAGMRGLTIEVNEFSGMAGLLQPNCRVDVISTFHDSQLNEPVTRTVVQNVPVVAVGKRLEAGKGPDAAPAKSVTLLVTPKQAETLELACSAGTGAVRTRLVLRGPADSTASASEGMSLAQVLGRTPAASKLDLLTAILRPRPKSAEPGPSVVATAPPPKNPTPRAAKWTVEVISGIEQSKVEFELPPGSALTDLPDGQAIPGTKEP